MVQISALGHEKSKPQLKLNHDDVTKNHVKVEIDTKKEAKTSSRKMTQSQINTMARLSFVTL